MPIEDAAQPVVRHQLAPLLSYLDTAELLHVSETSLRRHVKAGLVPVVRIGRLVRFRPEDILRVVEAGLVLRQPPR
jgi:excisionase family DNA binding protein